MIVIVGNRLENQKTQQQAIAPMQSRLINHNGFVDQSTVKVISCLHFTPLNVQNVFLINAYFFNISISADRMLERPKGPYWFEMSCTCTCVLMEIVKNTHYHSLVQNTDLAP